MFLNYQIINKKIIEFSYKVILFFIFLLFLPGIFRILDHSFQKYFGLNRYINTFDFIFFSFFIFCFIKKIKLKKYLSTPLILFVFYLFLARASLFFSEGQIHFRAYYDLFKTFFVFVIFSIFLTPYFQKNYKNIIKICLVFFFTIALFESIVGILQFILQKSLGFSLLKELKFDINSKNFATVYIANNKHFFLNKILKVQSNYLLRACGTFLHPNTFSGFLNISSLLTLFLIYRSRRKFIFSLFLTLQLIALIFTFSRAGLVSFVCSAFFFFLLMIYKKYEIKKMFLIFLSILLLIGGFFSKYLIERGFVGDFFQSKKAKEVNLGSANTRVLLKDVSINMIKKHPFFGIGFRNFLIKRQEYTCEKTQRAYVHNIYLLIAAETGLISLFIFLLFLSIIFINSLRYCLNPFSIAIICSISSLLLIGYIDHYPISSFFGRIMLFSFLGFLNFSIKANKHFAYFQKVFLYQ